MHKLFISMTKEEFERYQPPSTEDIEEALRKGAEDCRKAEEAYAAPYIDNGIFYRKS